MSVTEELVRLVKVEMLKGAAKVERQKVKVPDGFQRRQIRLPPKMPSSRLRATAMTKGDKVLVILFRYLLGIGSLFALVPVFMPMSWMAATHRWLGLGEMPTGPIVEHLARSLSAFYALVGALCLVMASDLDRYRPLVRFFGVCLALLGIVFTGVDLAAGMPWWWTALEGPGAVPIGALVYFLARPGHNPCKQERTTCQPHATLPS
jgi:hypothetical protein